MAYNIRALEGFNTDLFAAIEWHLEINPKLAGQLIKEIERTFEIIATHPLSFQKVYKRTRKVNLIRFPYKIVFEVRKKDVIVIAFAHHKRIPKYWEARK